jgi:bloom syndrome protein
MYDYIIDFCNDFTILCSCLSTGHDFRPDYGQLGILRREYPQVPLMALTATANKRVVKDAIKCLGMRNPYEYHDSFNRPNLHYEVRKKDGKSIEVMAEYIAKRKKDSGVIYCLSRKDCETVSAKIQEKLQEKGQGNVRVSFYHADLDPVERARRHHAWSNGTISVLCATIAFGKFREFARRVDITLTHITTRTLSFSLLL